MHGAQTMDECAIACLKIKECKEITIDPDEGPKGWGCVLHASGCQRNGGPIYGLKTNIYSVSNEPPSTKVVSTASKPLESESKNPVSQPGKVTTLTKPGNIEPKVKTTTKKNIGGNQEQNSIPGHIIIIAVIIGIALLLAISSAFVFKKYKSKSECSDLDETKADMEQDANNQ